MNSTILDLALDISADFCETKKLYETNIELIWNCWHSFLQLILTCLNFPFQKVISPSDVVQSKYLHYIQAFHYLYIL